MEFQGKLQIYKKLHMYQMPVKEHKKDGHLLIPVPNLILFKRISQTKQPYLGTVHLNLESETMMVRKTLCVVIFGLISLGVNAQWYNTRYGVENLDDLNNIQLTESYSIAKASSIVGMSLTIVGAGIVVGSVAYTAGSAMVYVFTLGTTQEPKTRGGLLIAGSVTALVGTAFWISGGSRKRQLKPILYTRGLISNVSISPGAGYERLTATYYPAFTVRVVF